MLLGHTKFAPDWAFGLLKQRFRRTLVGCIEVVNSSATVNHAQLVGRENGEVIVKQYNWAGFFAPYFRRQAFESLHHLVFDSRTPGKVLVRKEKDGEVEILQVLSKAHLNWKPSQDQRYNLLDYQEKGRSISMKKSGSLFQKRVTT